MGVLHFKYTQKTDKDGDDVEALSKADFRSFNTSVLGLGSISQDSQYLEALAAAFDLEGFTDFCNQIDPHLVVPEYLERFLNWIFETISAEFKIEEKLDDMFLWAPLPFFAKFMGDGVLFLWNTRKMHPTTIGNIVVSLLGICRSYQSGFLPMARPSFVKPPPRLRCGVARGQVISVGNGSDFVGSCINVAARLQKLGTMTFAFSRRGFDPERCFDKGWHDEFVTRKVSIRGIGDDEMVVILKREFEALDPKDAAQFKTV